MKPTKASHALGLPPRPGTAPPAAGHPSPPPSGATLVPTAGQSGGHTGLTMATEALPVSVAALATPTRRCSGVVPLGTEVTVGGCLEPSCMATPKNSDRRIMLPRSSRSIRQDVMQARAPEDSSAGAEPAVPAGQVAAPGTSARCGVHVAPLEFRDDSGAACQLSILPTPKNSERGSSGCVRVMMPRSSHSMRHNVIQARGGEQADVVSDNLAQPSPAAGCGTPSRRGAVGVPTALGDEVEHSTVRWDSGPLATPKNGERRDLSGSVQLMAPLWRGSGAAPAPMPSAPAREAHSGGQVASQVQAPSPIGFAPAPPAQPAVIRRPPTPMCQEVMEAAPVAVGTPMRRSPTPLGAEVASNPVVSWVSVATPKNLDRRDLNGSMQLNAPLWRGSAGTPLGAELQVGSS